MKLLFDIQYFADDSSSKTEKATPKKRQEARKRGMVPKSREVTSAFLLLFSVLSIKFLKGVIISPINQFTKYSFSNLNIKIEDKNVLYQYLTTTLFSILKAVLPIATILLVTALLLESFQTGFLFSTESLRISFNKINPLEGFKRIFSINSVIELIKSLFKVTIIGYVAYSYTQSFAKDLLIMSELNIMSIINLAFTSIINVILWMSIMFFGIAIIDFIFQRQQYEKKLMMSKEEIKEEYKQTEGNPQIKSKIKEVQRKISLQRMFQQLPQADVVITNPTHYAVAIMYDPDKYEAPKVIAKGKDYVAQKIKEEAKRLNIQIVENKPLAQSLYKMCEIGDLIPKDLYQAVAEVLAYIYSLNNYQKVKNR
ncbi:flagellar biosynthesis protein FlhB [Caldicellulosiruptoraceae bacterium PP1]